MALDYMRMAKLTDLASKIAVVNISTNTENGRGTPPLREDKVVVTPVAEANQVTIAATCQ